MGMFTDFAQNKINDAILRGQALGAPATWFIALLKCTKGQRANSTAYALNDTIAVLISGKNYLYKVTTAGTTAAAQPGTLTGAANEVITDGTAVLTEQTAALDAATALVEPSGGSYARVSVTASLANFAGTQGAGTTVASTGTTGTSSNNGTIAFPVPTADQTTGTEKIWGAAFYDASSAGNAWMWMGLTAVQSVLNGQAAPSFAAATLTTQIGN